MLEMAGLAKDLINVAISPGGTSFLSENFLHFSIAAVNSFSFTVLTDHQPHLHEKLLLQIHRTP